MKLSNFVLERVEGTSILNRKYFATVDCQSGLLFWKKTMRRNICREYAGFWHFADTGKFTPGFQVEALARAWTAQTGEEC